jgi:hypothetical protein
MASHRWRNVMESTEDNQTIPVLEPETDDPQTRLARQAEQRRFVKAFSARATRLRGPQPLSARPGLLIGAVVAVLAVGFAVGAIPRLIRQSSSSGPGVGTTQSPTASLSPTAAPRRGLAPETPTAAGYAGPRGGQVAAPAGPGTRRAGPVPTRGTAKATVTTSRTGQTASAPNPAQAPTKTQSTPTQSPSPSPPPTPTPSATATTATASAVTGYGCAQASGASFAAHGWFSDGTQGFYYASAGGLTSDGCNGSYIAMPMSGSSSADDSSNYGLWKFRLDPASSAASLRCDVSVYIPDASSIKDVGGNPAYYTVYASATNSGTVLGSFSVKQVSNLGQWVDGGTYTVTDGGAVTVMVHSRGEDYNSAGNYDGAHIAVGPVRTTCQS